MRSPLFDQPQGFVAVTREPAAMPLVFQDAGNKFTDVGFVVDNQDVSRHRSLLASQRWAQRT